MSNELHQSNDRAERRALTDTPVFSGETVMHDADAAALENGRTMANDPLPEYTSYPGDASRNQLFGADMDSKCDACGEGRMIRPDGWDALRCTKCGNVWEP